MIWTMIVYFIIPLLGLAWGWLHLFLWRGPVHPGLTGDCAGCGYSMVGLGASEICPECGSGERWLPMPSHAQSKGGFIRLGVSVLLCFAVTSWATIRLGESVSSLALVFCASAFSYLTTAAIIRTRGERIAYFVKAPAWIVVASLEVASTEMQSDPFILVMIRLLGALIFAASAVFALTALKERRPTVSVGRGD